MWEEDHRVQEVVGRGSSCPAGNGRHECKTYLSVFPVEGGTRVHRRTEGLPHSRSPVGRGLIPGFPWTAGPVAPY